MSRFQGTISCTWNTPMDLLLLPIDTSSHTFRHKVCKTPGQTVNPWRIWAALSWAAFAPLKQHTMPECPSQNPSSATSFLRGFQNLPDRPCLWHSMSIPGTDTAGADISPAAQGSMPQSSLTAWLTQAPASTTLLPISDKFPFARFSQEKQAHVLAWRTGVHSRLGKQDLISLLQALAESSDSSLAIAHNSLDFFFHFSLCGVVDQILTQSHETVWSMLHRFLVSVSSLLKSGWIVYLCFVNWDIDPMKC